MKKYSWYFIVKKMHKALSCKCEKHSTLLHKNCEWVHLVLQLTTTVEENKSKLYVCLIVSSTGRCSTTDVTFSRNYPFLYTIFLPPPPYSSFSPTFCFVYLSLQVYTDKKCHRLRMHDKKTKKEQLIICKLVQPAMHTGICWRPQSSTEARLQHSFPTCWASTCFARLSPFTRNNSISQLVDRRPSSYYKIISDSLKAYFIQQEDGIKIKLTMKDFVFTCVCFLCVFLFCFIPALFSFLFK